MPDQYEIDLNNAMKEVLKTVNFLKGSVKDLSGQLKDLGTSGAADVKGANAAMGDYAKTLQDKGVKSLKEFRTEQRMQNFVVRESRQAIMAVTMALGFLTQGYDKTGGTVKNVSTGLLSGIAAMESTEFAMFSIGRAGTSMGGAVGNALTKFSTFGGPISIFLGIASGLIAFFVSLKAESAKAAEEGLKKSRQELEKIIGLYDTYQNKLKGDPSDKVKLSKEEANILIAKLEIYSKVIAAQMKGEKDIQLVINDVGKTKAEVLAMEQAANEAIGKTLEQNKKLYGDISNILKTRQMSVFTSDAIAGGKSLDERLRNIYSNDDPNKKLGGILAGRGVTLRDKNGELIKQELLDEKALAELHKDDAKRVADAGKNILDAEKSRIDLANQAYQAEQQYLNDLNGGLGDLANGLQAIAIAGDSGLAKLIQMAQMALRVAETMAMMDAGKMSSGGGILSLIGSFLGFRGLFDAGGYTGSGGKYEPAGIVHRGEYVMPKHVVDTVGVDFMQSIHKQYGGYANGGYVNPPSYGMMPKIQVIIHSPITLGEGLKVEIPRYNKWDKNKRV